MLPDKIEKAELFNCNFFLFLEVDYKKEEEEQIYSRRKWNLGWLKKDYLRTLNKLFSINPNEL